jgi:3-carboxy-cis,cis-muconate cycloisomerase
MSEAVEPIISSGVSGVPARGPVRQEVDDRAWLRALLAVEAALARAEARAGLITEQDAAAIARACRPEAFDLDALARAAAEIGNPVAPLVRALVAAVHGPAARQVHRGATSQDLIDTAAMVVVQRALLALLADLDGACDTAAALATRHRRALMAGRTSVQPAQPITFGLKVAGWLSGLDESAGRLDEIRRRRLAVQLGGAAGTLASLGPAGLQVVSHLASELGLAAPDLPGHSNRTRIAELAGALGATAGAVGKPARDIMQLAHWDVAEVAEVRAGGRVSGSSARPDRRSPLAAISAATCADGAPALVTSILVDMPYEYERTAGTWQLEWRPLCDLLVAVGSAAAWLHESLQQLAVDEQRMRANLERMRRPMTEAGDPSSHAGNAPTFIDRALAAHHERRRRTSR